MYTRLVLSSVTFMTDIKQRLTECINKVRKTKIVEKVKKKKKNKLSSSNCINGVFTYKSKANIDFETLCQKRLPGFTGAGISGGSTFADLQGSVERGGGVRGVGGREAFTNDRHCFFSSS